ncbi:MAG: hypothetical protein K0R92_235 [Lachnospiraceae bacterium]|jgi:hypothetical protein|nr:hypothetical protein [Lachnospiraceae bacterium]
MRIKSGYILRKIAGSDMVVPVGSNIADFNGIISLNESAAFLWRHLTEGVELPRLVAVLAEEYNISKEQAQVDTENFIAGLQQANILMEV